eukprot:2253705-Rhodomonas_salina.1
MIAKVGELLTRLTPYVLGVRDEKTCRYAMGRKTFWKIRDGVEEIYAIVPFEGRLKNRLPATSHLWHVQGLFTRTANALRWACGLGARAGINETGNFGCDTRQRFFEAGSSLVCHFRLPTDSYLEDSSHICGVKIPAKRARFWEQFASRDGLEFDDDRCPEEPEEIVEGYTSPRTNRRKRRRDDIDDSEQRLRDSDVIVID